MQPAVTLKRSLGFWAIVAFGVGDILGAGIYALIGKISGIAGAYSWLSFLVALVVAGFTALSYAELSGRIPKSAGEAAFIEAGFRKPWFSLLIGWLVLCSGIVSMATVSRAFAGYVHPFLQAVPVPAVILVFLIGFGLVNFWGIRQSSGVNIVCTITEFTGLLIVLAVGVRYWMQGSAGPAAPAATIEWPSIFQAGALAFFAFIGFEDMVNVAEEAKEPEKNLPRAILTALALAGALYIVIAVLAVSIVPPGILAASPSPLLDVVRTAEPRFPVKGFTLIAVFAISNTALLNFVMASRLVYGMAQQKLLPSFLGRVHPSRRTPHMAIAAVLAVAVVLALSGDLAFLAGTTSTLLLSVFAAVNGSLLLIKRRDSSGGSFHVPHLVPALGIAASLGLLAFVPRASFITASVITAIGLGILGLRRVASH